jgi:hypothetical protein
MKTLRYEFQTARGFLMNTRENVIDARLLGITLTNTLQTEVTVVAVKHDGLQNRYLTVCKYKPTTNK